MFTYAHRYVLAYAYMRMDVLESYHLFHGEDVCLCSGWIATAFHVTPAPIFAARLLHLPAWPRLWRRSEQLPGALRALGAGNLATCPERGSPGAGAGCVPARAAPPSSLHGPNLAPGFLTAWLQQ